MKSPNVDSNVNSTLITSGDGNLSCVKTKTNLYFIWQIQTAVAKSYDVLITKLDNSVINLSFVGSSGTKSIAFDLPLACKTVSITLVG